MGGLLRGGGGGKGYVAPLSNYWGGGGGLAPSLPTPMKKWKKKLNFTTAGD